MANVSEWSTTAASNNSAAPNGAPEGMAPSGVNDVIRENMAALAKVYKDRNGSLVSAGTSTAYTLTTNNSHTQLSDIGLTYFRVDEVNTGSSTLAVDGLTAKTMKLGGSNLIAGDLLADSTVGVIYNSNQDVFDVVSITRPNTGPDLLQTVTASSSATIDIGESGEIDSTYSRYLIVLENVIPATDDVELRMRTSANTGSSYDTTSSYNWKAVEDGTAEQSSSSDYIKVCATASSEGVGSGTNENGVSGEVILLDPSDSSYSVIYGEGIFIDRNTLPALFSFSGQRTSAAAVDAVRFYFNSGNVESGTFKLYGIR